MEALVKRGLMTKKEGHLIGANPRRRKFPLANAWSCARSSAGRYTFGKEIRRIREAKKVKSAVKTPKGFGSRD